MRKSSGFSLLSGPQKIILAGGAVAALAALAVLAAPYVPRMRDFDQTFYPAIRYALAGQNPYIAAYPVTDQGLPPAFFSPPWLLLILAPFGLVPFELARALWMIFLVVVTCLGISLLSSWQLRGPWALALAALPWSLVGILFGQVSALVFLGAVLAISQAARPAGPGYKSAGLILLGVILLGLKPQLGGFIVLALGGWLLWRGDRRLWLVAGGGLLFLLLVWLVYPAWPLADSFTAGRIPAAHWQSTLERELGLWQLPAWLAWPVRLGVVGVMLVWAWRARGLTPAWWSAMLAATLIITPYSRAYDGVLLLPLLGQMIARQWPRAVIFLAVVVGYTMLPLGELGSVVTPLVAWLLFVPWSGLVVPRGAPPAPQRRERAASAADVLTSPPTPQKGEGPVSAAGALRESSGESVEGGGEVG